MRVSSKWIATTILLIIVLAVASVYIFIPSRLFVSTVVKANCNAIAASRTINNKQWRNAFYAHTDSSFLLNGYSYTVADPLYNAADINISHNEDQYRTHIMFIKLSEDSCMVRWTTTIAAGNSPLSRITSYSKAVALKRNMEEVTGQLQSYWRNSKNIYGYNITHTTLTDTFLVSIKQEKRSQPSISDIYALVNDLKSYIKKQGATETNYPMLNITFTGNSFETMVGIPVNKTLPAYSNIYPKRLSPIKDKILTTDVQGGPATIRQAYQQIELYMNDHSLAAPVIPFEFMITDRSKEADTSKWLTKIFYPII